MKVRHVIGIAVVVLIILAILHYFTKHNGQGVASSFMPGVNG